MHLLYLFYISKVGGKLAVPILFKKKSCFIGAWKEIIMTVATFWILFILKLNLFSFLLPRSITSCRFEPYPSFEKILFFISNDPYLTLCNVQKRKIEVKRGNKLFLNTFQNLIHLRQQKRVDFEMNGFYWSKGYIHYLSWNYFFLEEFVTIFSHSNIYFSLSIISRQ